MMGQAVMQRSAIRTDQYIILVGNIPWKCKWQDLKDLVRRYSKAVEHVEVYLAPDGRSRGFGWVRIKGREEALKVIHQLDGHEWEGRALMAKLGNEHDVCPTADPTGKIPEATTPPLPAPSPTDSRSSSFSQASVQSPPFQPPPYGHDGECPQWPVFPDGVFYAPAQGLPVSYHSDAAYGLGYATHMPQQLPNTCFFPQPMYGPCSAFQYDYTSTLFPGNMPPDSFKVLIDHSYNCVEPQPFTVVPVAGGLPVNLSNGAIVTEPRGIHVRNLPYDISWKELRDHLQEAGTIVRCEVPKGSNGKGKGYGTVLFKTQEEADRCLDMFNGKVLKGREIYMRRDKFATRKTSNE